MMHTIPNDTLVLAAVLLIALVTAAIVWFVMQKQRSTKLKQHFGPEYDRAVSELGKTKAEAELLKREKRVASLSITPISAADAARFSNAWNILQGRFVDNPKGVVADADALVRELMLKRGYPMGDFEVRAADISVDHPNVVKNYRAAHAIVVREARGEADTEELRKAVVHYRILFNELLGIMPANIVTDPALRSISVRS